MANAVALNMKFIAETSSIQAGGKETSRMLTQLGNDVLKAANTFKGFADSNAAAAAAQQNLTTDANLLAYQLKEGFINADQFRQEMELLTSAAKKQASAFAEGASLTSQMATEQEKHAQTLDRLDELLTSGAISQETYNRAVEQAEKGLSSSKAAVDAQNASLARAKSITKSVETEEEKYAATVKELEDLLADGAISQQTFNRAMQKAAPQIKQVEKEVDSTTNHLKKMSSQLRTLIAIEFGRILASGFSMVTNAIGGFVSSIRQSVDETAKLAKQTGIAVEELQVFQLAAQMSGVDNLVEPIRKLGIEIGKASETGDFKKFEKLGLNFAELQRMAPEEQFKAIAAQIAALPTAAERAAAAVAIFGEQGVKMLPLFEANLQAVQERMERLGIVLSEGQTGAIEEMNDALTLVQATFEGIIGQVTANLAPVVTALVEEFLSFVEGYQGLGEGTGGTALADSITDALFNGAEYLADLLDYAVASLNEWGVSVESTFAGLQATFQFFADAVTFLSDAFYTVRSIFNDFLASFAEVASKFVAYFSSNGAEFLDAFAQNLRASAEQDRQQISGPERAAPQQQGEGMFGGAVRRGRQAYSDSRSPEAQAARDAKRAEEQAARDAAQKEAERLRKEEERRKEEQKMIDDYNKKVLEAEGKALEASLKYEQDRVEGLAAVNQKALEVSDIRSGGIGAFIALATGREDPAVTESRKQLQELKALNENVRQLKALPVEIMGAA